MPHDQIQSPQRDKGKPVSNTDVTTVLKLLHGGSDTWKSVTRQIAKITTIVLPQCGHTEPTIAATHPETRIDARGERKGGVFP